MSRAPVLSLPCSIRAGALPPRVFAALVLAVLAGLALACKRESAATTSAELLPERYQYLRTGWIEPDDVARVRAGLPYTRIEMTTWNPWLLGGPQIAFERDGAASVVGESPQLGKLSIFDFGQLCYLIERIGFESYEPQYSWGGFDRSTITIKVWRDGRAEPIVVADDGGAGPMDFHTLCLAIEGTATRIRPR